jgi:hypothetical protein
MQKPTTKTRSLKTEYMTFRLTPREKRSIVKLAESMDTHPSGLIRKHFLELLNPKSK